MESLNWKTDIENDNQVPKNQLDCTPGSRHQFQKQQTRERSTKPCHIPPIYNMCGLHLSRILEFNDGHKWIARIQLHELNNECKKRFLHEQVNVPVREVFGYETNPDLIGRTDFTEQGDYNIPPKFKAKFCHEIACIHINLANPRTVSHNLTSNQAAMSTIRFPKIGMIAKRDDGTYEIEAIPGLGGPFDMAVEYFATRGEHTKFPLEEGYMRDHLPEEYADEIIASTGAYSSRIQAQRFDIIVRNEGPFPLRHTDFLHGNIIADDKFNVLSVYYRLGKCWDYSVGEG
ncbi:Aminoglycoside phosphotransferase [Penicillium cf. griseofulvum]|nr:Aminoglycoside phosphotransferase [Penicillium cf. griseofulvum]